MKFRFWPSAWSSKNRKSSRGFQAAQINRLVNSWAATSASMDSLIRGSLVGIRNRSRDLGRNNPYAKAFFRDVVVNVVGSGIPFQSQVRMLRGEKLDEAVNDLIETKFDEWCRKENCHVAGELSFQDIQQLVMREVAEGGEFFIRKIKQRFGDSKIPFALELIEADRIDENYNGIAENGNEIIMGVEKDKWGRRTAYYILPRHPGDNTSSRVDGNSRMAVRIIAEEIIPLFIPERHPQTRGIPWLTSVIMRLHHMDGYEQSEVIAARASAAIMGFIESPEGEVREDATHNGERITDFEPGVYKYLGPGEKVNVPKLDRPGGQLTPFMSFMLKGFSAGAGGSYESISKDYSQSNYSSSRLSLLSERDYWRIIQRWLIQNFHQPIFEAWLDMATLSGELDLRGYETSPERFRCVKWMPRGWAWVDPAKEVAAYKEAVRGGMKTLTDIYAEEGKDYEEAVIQRSREVKLAKANGLIFDTDASVDRYRGSDSGKPDSGQSTEE
jgi:lambda family phage portal protein